MLRRFALIQALMFWQGGFLFYSAVVVPIGTDILGSSFEQGRITRWVTNYMNLIGAVAMVIFARDQIRTFDLNRRRKIGRWICWGIMAGGLAGLATLHPTMDALVRYDGDSAKFIDWREFRFRHRIYLWISTFQWVAGMVYLVLTLYAWRAEDEEILLRKVRLEK